MESYLSVFRHLPSPAMLLDERGRIEDMNQAGRAAFPAPGFEGALTRWLKKDLAAFRASHDNSRMLEKPLPSRTGPPRFFRVRMAKVAPDQARSGVVVLLADITERHRILEELGRLASLVDFSDDAILSVSLNGRILSWNHGAEKIYGYPAERIRGKTFMILVPRGLRDMARKILSRAAQGQALSRHETVHRHSDGHIFPVSATFSPFENYSEISGVSIIARDISSRKQAEQDLKVSHERLENLLNETVKSLSATHEKRDLYTAGHQQRVAKVAGRIASRMGLNASEGECLRTAALLHDIGKVCIPMAILAKPARLSPEEMGIIKKHPETGYDILQNIPFPQPVGAIILQHHERLDGSGYPFGLKGQDIHPAARILAVADTLEAMSSHRPYRPALGIKAALDEFHEKSGTLYDPDVCSALFDLVKAGAIRWTKGELQCR